MCAKGEVVASLTMCAMERVLVVLSPFFIVQCALLQWLYLHYFQVIFIFEHTSGVSC